MEQHSEPIATPPLGSPTEHSPVFILSVQLLASLLLGTVGVLLFHLFATAVGWDAGVLQTPLSAEATPAERWQMRAFLGFSHLLTFIAAGWVVVHLFYPPLRRALQYLQVHRHPQRYAVWGGVALLLAALPLVLYVYEINRALPIPEAWRQAESQANEMLKGLLQMDDAWELLANLVIIAFLPAIGEELVFRGVVQQQLLRWVHSPWAAIWLSGAIFSFAHFQWEGFLPRWLLGVLLGWLYWRFQNLWVPIAAHFSNNALQVAAQYLYHRRLSSLNLEDDIAVPFYAAAISTALALAIAYSLHRRALATALHPYGGSS